MEGLELFLEPESEQSFKVIETRFGTTSSILPFFEGGTDFRTTLIRVLEITAYPDAEYEPERFSPEEQKWLIKVGLVNPATQAFHEPKILLANLGKHLYQSLFPGSTKAENALRALWQKAKPSGDELHIQFRFEASSVEKNRAADYPWELAHDGERFLAWHKVSFSRYIAYGDLPPTLPPVNQINVLLVSSEAYNTGQGLKKFSRSERKAIREGLETASEQGHIRLIDLAEEIDDTPTFKELTKYLEEHRGLDQPHVLHFDGHGLYGRKCSCCGKIYPGINTQICVNPTCNKNALQSAQGYLVFEQESGEPDYVSAETLGTVIENLTPNRDDSGQGRLAVVVLSACQSGMAAAGDSVFNGTAQTLIHHAMPAVVAMQYSVGVKAATNFAESFYRSLGQKDPLATAVRKARIAMDLDEHHWYRPVLYLRWHDNVGGQLFASEVSTPQTNIGVPFQAPPLPGYYVERPEVSDALKTELLQSQSDRNRSESALMISAIHGLGAIGKSTLATALAYDADIKAHFSDGILWVTLGQNPDILSSLGSWIQALGDHTFKDTTIGTSSSHLRTLLQNKAMLLVVDDAWDSSHVEAFRVGGPQCQVLVTSRDKLIATTVGANLFSLDVMSAPQALTLLARRLRRDLTASEKPQAEALAHEVGYLPLALDLAAAQVADGISWTELLDDLRAEVAYLETFDLVGAEEVSDEDEGTSKRLSLRRSLNLSIRRLSDAYRQQFSWLGVLPEDVRINQAMAATLWRLSNPRQARDILRYLRDKAILLDGVPLADGTQTYRLHDMFHDLAMSLLTTSSENNLPGLGLTLPEAHEALLNRYWEKTQQEKWHTIPGDGYIHSHLIWHMEEASRIDDIHAVLSETSETERNGWYEARERLGQTAGYIADVHKAWKLVNSSTDIGSSAESIGWQCRYALIISSLNSISNIPKELLIALVEKGVWTPEQGLAYARQGTDFQKKADGLTNLAEILPPQLSQEVLADALGAVQAVGNEIHQAEALSALAEKLPETLLLEALSTAQAIQSKRWYQVQALSALAEKLPETLLPEALSAAQAISYDESRAEALSALAKQLPEALKSEAMSEEQEFSHDETRAKEQSD